MTPTTTRLAALLLVCASCGEPPRPHPATPPADELPVVTATDAEFSWQDPGLVAGDCDRSAAISSAASSISVHAGATLDTAIAVHAVDRLVAPRLAGLLLADALPTESTVLVQPGGALRLSYGDTFDTRWRGRVPQWTDSDVPGVSVDPLDDDLAQPDPGVKILRDADLQAAQDLFWVRDLEQRVTLHLRGEVSYCFSLGRGVESLVLSDPDGQRHTTIESGSGATVAVRAEGGDWQTVWTAANEGRHQPAISLPEALVGAQQICVALASPADGEMVLEQLQLTITSQAADTRALTHFEQGEHDLSYDDAPESSHRAVVSWDAQRLTHCEPAPSPADSTPVIEEQQDRLILQLSADTRVELQRNAAGVPGAIAAVRVGSHTLLAAPPGAREAPLATLTMLDGDPASVGPPFSWPQYIESYYEPYYESGGQQPPTWTSRFQRTHRQISLADAAYLGASVEQGGAVLRFEVSDAEGDGVVALRFEPSTQSVDGLTVAGLAVRAQVSGSGLLRAERLALSFPLMVNRGDWIVEQTFRNLVEERIGLEGARRYSRVKWIGEHQSFALRTGPGRTVMAMFDEPVAADVATALEGGRHVFRVDIPLGRGTSRTTPGIHWLLAPLGASDGWTAVNAWTAIYEAVKQQYSAELGLLTSRPTPAEVWMAPSPEQVLAARKSYWESGAPAQGDSWFDWWVDHELPRAAAAGVRRVVLQSPWRSDADSLPAAPPAEPWELPDPGSAQAVWDLDVSEVLGGRDGLARLVGAAHERGIEVTLWFPSALSLHSPLLEEHPEWAAWRQDGVPEDRGWGDIVGIADDDAVTAHLMAKLAALHQDVPFDGAWMDSWAGLSILTDYAQLQPTPTLKRAIDMQRAMAEMGLRYVGVEGLGPLGSPDAYGDYESWSGPPIVNDDTNAILDRIRQHEYLLYRIGSGSYIDLPVFHRALASGGMFYVANFDEVDLLSEADRTWLRRLHRSYDAVVDLMQRRTVLHDDEDRWLGVSWSGQDSGARVVFAFAPFVYRPAGCIAITMLNDDGAAGAAEITASDWTVQPWRIYRIEPAQGCDT